jgi:hypothetical protein
VFHVEKHLGHDPLGHRCRIVEPLEIRLGGQHFGRFDKIEVEIASAPGNRLMPAAEQKSGDGQPLLQMLPLEPGVEFVLAASTAVVENREDSGLRSRHRYFAATTMISTL